MDSPLDSTVDLQNELIEALNAPSPKEPAKPARKVNVKDKAPPVVLTDYERICKFMELDKMKEASLGKLKSAHETGKLGWNKEQLGAGCVCSADGLKLSKSALGFGGAVGAQLYSAGVHCFAFKVDDPVDDAFWVGVAYSDVWIDEPPKENTKTIVWSGGSATRPGTVRIHGEKMRNQPTYQTGDIIGVSLDMDSGDMFFFLNGKKVIEWRGVLRGPVYPYFCLRHIGPSATLLQTWSVATEVGDAEEGKDRVFRDVVGGSQVENLPDVDGSILEGGGQVLRIALGVCALLKRPMRIHSIRAGRPNPGLGHQHSTGAKLVADICCGMVKPDAIQFGGHCAGATELYLWPGVKGLRGGEFIADPHTAGSITLLLQASLPCALLGARSEAVKMILRGGTNTSGSPSIDFIPSCLFPTLQKFGVPKENMSMKLTTRGFYPIGRGEVIFDITPVNQLNAINLTDRGEPKRVTGVISASGIGRRAAKDVSPYVKGALKAKFGDALPIDIVIAQEPEGVDPATETAPAPKAPQQKGGKGGKQQQKEAPEKEKQGLSFKERQAMTNERKAKFAGVINTQLVLETTTGCLITGSSLIQESGKSGSGVISHQDAGKKAAAMLIENWEAGGCVDEYLMDQIIIYMAVAKGTSKVLCPGKTGCTSEHLATAVHFVELLCGVKFVFGAEGPKGEKVIECEGLDIFGK